MYSTLDLKNFLEQFDDVVDVVILEDNKYEHSTYVILKTDLLDDIETKSFKITGIGSSEFYIQKDNGREFTLQVSDFERDAEISI